MENTNVLLLVMVPCLLLGPGLPPTVHGQEESEKLVFLSYPDPAEDLIARIVGEVGKAYREKHPGVRIEVRTDVPFGRARRMVLQHENHVMMVSKRMFGMRRQHLKRNNRINQFKLNAFTPLAIRVIRSREKVLARERLGIMSDDQSAAMNSFLSFFYSKRARSIMNEMRYMEPVEREKSSEQSEK